MFETPIQNLYIITPALWGTFIVYLAWYFTRAKRYSPLTHTEAKQLWTLHKLDTECTAKKWRQLKNGKQTIGFECECGYKHFQKKPLVTHAPTTISTAQASAFDRLHTSHKSN